MQSPRLADGYSAADVTPNTMIVLRHPQGANQLIPFDTRTKRRGATLCTTKTTLRLTLIVILSANDQELSLR
jgi:hypothetical protein